MKKTVLLAAGLLCLASAAFADVTVSVGADNYWRQPAAGQKDSGWADRGTFQNRDTNWEHGHCVRDWQNHEYCRN